MKRDYILQILFFSGLWGLCEAVLGGYLYRINYEYASVPLTAIGFMILTIAAIRLPQKGSLVLIGAVAMLYKFLNEPFFACHFLGIFLLGFSYEVALRVFKIRSKAGLGILATYLGYALFGFTITYLFRYHYWIEEGMPKLIYYIVTSGTVAAMINAVLVPLTHSVAQAIHRSSTKIFLFKPRFATPGIAALTVVIWVLGITGWL